MSGPKGLRRFAKVQGRAKRFLKVHVSRVVDDLMMKFFNLLKRHNSYGPFSGGV